MSSFSLPQINDNPDGGWGPSSSNFPSEFKFKDIPYAPYSKSDKLGRFADWNDPSSDGRQTNLGLSSNQASRGGGPGRRGRDGQPAFGSGTASAFAYFHAEDESSFSLVDNKTTTTRRGGGMNRGRGLGRGGGGYGRGGNNQRGRGGFFGGRGGGQRGGRRGWRDWEKVRKFGSSIPTGSRTCFASGRMVAHGRHPLRSLLTGLCSRRSSSTVLRSSGSKLTSLKICKLFYEVLFRPQAHLGPVAKLTVACTPTTRLTTVSTRGMRNLSSSLTVSSTTPRPRMILSFRA